MNKIIAFMITALFLSFGCCKNEECKEDEERKEETKDYRDKYVGTWDLTTYISKFSSIPEESYSRFDTICYLGNISYGNTDSALNFEYTENNSISLNINEYGVLSGFNTGNGYSSGKFIDKVNLYIYLRWGGQGGGTIHTIKGTKKERRQNE